jgi:4-hydroxy-tetrahydrodipicolinate synthase
MEKKYCGVHVPTITPFTHDNRVDDEKIKSLTRFFVDSGVRCLVPTANNGEQPHLSSDERKHVWESTIKAGDGKVAVFPSITGNSTQEVAELARYAESIGADGVMVGPPYYFRMNEEELFDHFRSVAESVKIPVMIHNEPFIFKVDVQPELFARLNQIDNICLIKESTDNTQRVHEILRLCGDAVTIVVAGGGTALESMLLGAKAWMTGLNNFMPRVSVQMYNLAVIEHKYDDAKKIYFDKILPVHSCMKEIGKPVPTVKYALELLGYPVGNPRKPMHPLSDGDKTKIKQILKKIGIL